MHIYILFYVMDQTHKSQLIHCISNVNLIFIILYFVMGTLYPETNGLILLLGKP